MRFTLVDEIVQWQAGNSLRAKKRLSLAEEYLADHFPTFPVMPGVMMLQALVESASWLWRVTTQFEHSVIVLREVKNVKYGSFMQPGRTLDLEVTWAKQDGMMTTFKGKGVTDEGQQTVSAQFTLTAYNLSGRGMSGPIVDERLKQHWKERWDWLTGQLKAKG
jgi:3-hydroxyacyl-[acyl-carrier-protein] dehydratase